MKKLLLIAATAFMFLPAMAQKQTATAEQRAERKTARITRELQLTEDQKPKVQAETLKFVKAADAVRAKHTDQKSEAAKTEFKAARQDYRTAMKGILTAEQFTRWQEMEKGHAKTKNSAPKTGNK
jgi:periplasmic protein CpxP/Spy